MSLVVGSKTPVSVLQEYLFKAGEVPQYDLIHDGTGTHTPTFIYRLTFKNHVVEGRGSTKKEAKQDTARLMLEALKATNGVETKIESETISLCKTANKYNAVGALAEFCAGIRYFQGPTYQDIREEGPPHARLFTVRCTVSKLSETAIAGTKKQAKQQAAQQILNRLNELNFVNNESNEPPPDSSFGNLDADLVKKVIDHFKSLKAFNEQFIFGGSISQYHMAYKGDHTLPSETVNTMIEKCKESDPLSWNLSYLHDNFETLFQEILMEVGVRGVYCQIPSLECNKKFCILTVSHSPPITVIGISTNEDEAKKEAILNYLHHLCVLMS